MKNLEKRFNTMKKLTVSKTCANKIPAMEGNPISETEVTDLLRMTLNWKAPGRDQITNYRLKQLTATHTHLPTFFNKLIKEGQIPNWLATDVTILISEDENTQRSKNYRPVTCLPKIYKTNKSIIRKQIQQYINNRNLMP